MAELVDAGIDADTVRAADPRALSTDIHGQGEAVALAARLAWSYGVPQPPPAQGSSPCAIGTPTSMQSPVAKITRASVSMVSAQ